MTKASLTSLHDHLQQKDYTKAMSDAVALYGPELYSFLVARLASRDEAADVLQNIYENMFKALDRFRGESSFRTWAFTITRHALINHRRAPQRRHPHVSPSGVLSQIEQHAQSTVEWYERTEGRSQFEQLRSELTDDEQLLITLRYGATLDQTASWEEVARAFLESKHGPGEISPEDLKKAAATQRQTFRRLQLRLREKARKQGLLPDV